MNKTVFKIFVTFVLLAAVISTLLLVINFFGFALLGSDTNYSADKTPRRILANISENLAETNDGFYLTQESVIPQDYWCILINEHGNIIWENNKPTDIPDAFTLNDIAQMSRWFLNDYPVYVRTEDYGLLVLGMPKNSVGKYEVEYSMDWFSTLPERIIYIFVFNLLLAVLLALLFGVKLYKQIKVLMNGIGDLLCEKNVNLPEKGIFKEVCRSLNRTSQAIERKNSALSSRDSARANWIAGISHDIRTPLSVVTGYSEALAGSRELSDENRGKAAAILSNSIKIKKLIEDLNLISSIEYDMQPAKKTAVRICPLLRRIVTDIINSGLNGKFSIDLDLRYENAIVSGDEALLERAIFNIINNAVLHNSGGCAINIKEYVHDNMVKIIISDNGKGVPDEVIENISSIPKAAHGLGLPMAYRIITVHGGSFNAYNDSGFCTEITLPL